MRTQRRAPIAPERAIRYLIQCEYTEADKLIESARYLSNNLYSHLSANAIDQFLQAIYDENYHFAYDVIAKMYGSLNQRIPWHIRALYSCYPLWKIYMHLVYDTFSDYAGELDRPGIIRLLDQVIANAFPAELWKEFKDESVYEQRPSEA